MNRKFLGALGVAWGGAILFFGVLNGIPEGTSADALGQKAGAVFGAIIFFAGIKQLLAKPAAPKG